VGDNDRDGLKQTILDFFVHDLEVKQADEVVEGASDSLNVSVVDDTFTENQDELNLTQFWEEGFQEIGNSNDSRHIPILIESCCVDETSAFREMKDVRVQSYRRNAVPHHGIGCIVVVAGGVVSNWALVAFSDHASFADVVAEAGFPCPGLSHDKDDLIFDFVDALFSFVEHVEAYLYVFLHNIYMKNMKKHLQTS